MYLLPSPSLSRQRYCVAWRLCVCLCVRSAAYNLGGEGNVLYPVLYSFNFVAIISSKTDANASMYLLPSPSLSGRRYCVARRLCVCLCVCLCVRNAAYSLSARRAVAARRISLGGEGNAIQCSLVLSSLQQLRKLYLFKHSFFLAHRVLCIATSRTSLST